LVVYFIGAASAVAENRAEVEAIAEADREDPGIEIGIPHDAETAERGVVVPSDGGIEPGLLDVGVERPAIAERDVEARLQREAPGEGKTLVMASSMKTRSEARADASALCSAAKGAALRSVPAAIGSQAAILRTRRGQALALAFDGGETAFISGVLTLQVTLPDSSRQIVAMLFPGDVFLSSLCASACGGGSGRGPRFGGCVLPRSISSPPAIMRYLDQAVPSQLARKPSMPRRSVNSIASRGWQPCSSSWHYAPA
jgi:hypothetical protein